MGSAHLQLRPPELLEGDVTLQVVALIPLVPVAREAPGGPLPRLIPPHRLLPMLPSLRSAGAPPAPPALLLPAQWAWLMRMR